MRPTLAAVLFAASLLPATPAFAAVLHVPADFPTIQAAVDAAGQGDTVVVSKGNYAEAVVVAGHSDLTVKGQGPVVIDATGLATGIAITDSTNVEVRGIGVLHAGTQGILVGTSSDVLVDKCSVVGSGGDGIRVDLGTHVIIDHCTVTDAAGNGINLFDAGGGGAINSQVTHDTITGSGGDGIRFGGPTGFVEHDTVTGSGNVGIEGLADAVNAAVAFNHVDDTTGSAILLLGSGASVAKNSVHGAGQSGVEIGAGADNATVAHNKILLAGTRGLSVSGDLCVGIANQIVQPGTCGLFTDATGGHFFVVHVVASQGDGFQVVGNGNAFSLCKSAKAAADGFSVPGANNAFTQCKAAASGALDLDDPAAGATTNTYTTCKFKTSNVP